MRGIQQAVGVSVRKMAAVAWLGALGCMSGCGAPANKFDQSTETGAINIVLVDMLDASTNQGLAERVWDKASMPKPADRAKYGKFGSFSAVETVVDGNTAKLKVEIHDISGATVGTKDWTLTKADGTWKIQTAPLP